MKALFFAAACLTGCAAPQKPAPPPDRPQSTRDYRLAFRGSEPPQRLTLPAADFRAITSIRQKVVAARQCELAHPGIEPRGMMVCVHPRLDVYDLEGARAGAWEHLSVVDRDGKFVAPEFTSERVSGRLKMAIRSMEAARGAQVPETAKAILLRPGYVASPRDPQLRPIDVRSLPKGTAFEDPYVPPHILLVP